MTTKDLLHLSATVGPAALLALAALNGGLWVIAAVLSLTVVNHLLDRMSPLAKGGRAAETATLSVILACCHFMLLMLVVWALAASHLGVAEKAGLFLAAGLWFGQVSNANAHELIHRGDRRLFALGKWIYISLLFGHHTSAHLLVHHRFVATPHDPNSARRGEGLYHFLPRAWYGSFIKGLRAESRRSTATRRTIWKHPYLSYVVGAALALLIALAFGGPKALAAYLALCLHAQSQLLMSDYVQHYGLRRHRVGAGFEPVGPQHSWNSGHWFSSAMLLNATRHSDHHAHPKRPYPALDLPNGAMLLPKPLPVMATVALVPPLWRRIMDPRLPKQPLE